jgi:hypothetical protein
MKGNERYNAALIALLNAIKDIVQKYELSEKEESGLKFDLFMGNKPIQEIKKPIEGK